MAVSLWFMGPDGPLETGLDRMEEALASRRYWLDLEIVDLPLLAPYQDRLPGHPLNWEDAGKPTQRPKLEEQGDHLFLVMRGLDTAHHRLADQLHTIQLACFLSAESLITIRSAPMATVEEVNGRLAKGQLQLQAGPDVLLHAILDDLVDRFGPHVEEWEAEMERLLKDALDRPRDRVMGRILAIRKHMLMLRRLAFSQREILSLLARERAGLIQPSWQPYFRDVLDHLTSLVEASETLRDSVGIAVDVYLNSVNNRLNEVMKVLTVISSIMLPLTLITGIFGMNFDKIPGLHHPWGLAWVLGAMLVVAIGMIIYFKRSRWL